ncbi:MAG TPA: DUF305 domain-containing protein [Micromonosporaceae bacterium]
MNRTLVRRSLLAGTTTVLTLLIATGCASGSTDHGGMAAGGPSATQPASGSTGQGHNDGDIAFAQMMIPHHQQAVEMATLAATRASDPQIKELAAQIKAAQAPEITTMTNWLKAWGMPTAAAHDMHEGMAHMPGMLSDQELAQLKAASGKDFDRLFARMMIAHHNGAIQMCRDVRIQGVSAEVNALATKIEQVQADEVAVLEEILDRL